MDALALLCTLHADGPATLRRLRAAGCDSLAALEAYPVEQLGELLHVTPAVARRLEREARALRSRVDDDPLEREEAPEGLTRGSLAAGSAQAESTAAGLDRVDQELLGRVLDTVREAPDATPPERASAEPTAPEPQPEPEPVPVAALPSEDPAPVQSPAPSALRAGTVDGLDAELSVELGRAGIRDLEALVAADCDDLAHRTGRSFAQLRRLQFLARRQLPREPERLEPRAPFGAGVPKPVEAARSAAPDADPAETASTASTPDGAAEASPASGPPPFGANIVEPVQPAPEPVVPTRQRTEAPGMEHPVSVEPDQTSPRRFWEPRSIYEARTAHLKGAGADQGKAPRGAEPAGPTEERTASKERGSEAPQPAPERTAPAASELLRPAAESSAEVDERTEVLRWNFEIPAPGTMPESIAAPDRRRIDSEREDAAGPFA